MGRTVISTTGRGFRTDVSAAEHRWVADEPVSAGGTEAGPTPYDLLAAALATCTTMTLRFYADREKYPLESVEATVTHDRQHAKDCEICLSKEGYVHRFDVAIRLSGELTAEQREKLIAIAAKCPVAKTLKNEIVVAHRSAEG